VSNSLSNILFRFIIEFEKITIMLLAIHVIDLSIKGELELALLGG
jgi:hypothetical protein